MRRRKIAEVIVVGTLVSGIVFLQSAPCVSEMTLGPFSEGKPRILIDLSHDERIMRTPSKHNVVCFDVLADTYDIIESDKAITYGLVQEADMILIGLPQVEFTVPEAEVISRFVSNGGGLLLLGEAKFDYRYAEPEFINSLSRSFGVEFDDDPSVMLNYTSEIQGQVHPVFEGVEEVFWAASGSLIVKNPSVPLLHREGKCIMAYLEYGKGRVIFLPDSDFFLFPYIEYEDNRQFVDNILNWLSQPRGPYLHYAELLDKSISLMETGKEQMRSGNFEMAKSTLVRSRDYLERASAIYESDEIERSLRIIDSLITQAGTGVKAESLFQEGKTLYESGQCVSAIEKLEEAKYLFESFNDKGSEMCTSLIEECEQTVNSQKNQGSSVTAATQQSSPAEPLIPGDIRFLYYVILAGAGIMVAVAIVTKKKMRKKPRDDDTKIY
ncbi:MAG: hypothetical protein WBA22_04000 [Candidatus Methanofastidiosia archaeon]